MQADYRNLRPQLDGYGVVVADCRMESMENAVAAALNKGTFGIWKYNILLLIRCKSS